MIRLILTFLIFWLGLIVFPFGVSIYETPKILAVFIALPLFFWMVVVKKKVIVWDIKIWIALGVFLTISLLQVAVYGGTVVLGDIYRYNGVLLQILLILFAIFSAREKVEFLPKTVLVSMAVFLISGFLINRDPAGRAIGLLGDPNSLAAGCLFYLSVLFFKIKIDSKVKLFLSSLIILILFLTGSRSGYVGFGALLFLGIFLKKLASKSIIAMLFLVIIIISALPYFQSDNSWENRSHIWTNSLSIIGTVPLYGIGAGNFKTFYHQQAVKSQSSTEFLNVDSPHNIILEWYINFGPVAFILLIYLFGRSAKNLLSQKNFFIFTNLAVFLIMFWFNPLSVYLKILLWWSIGQGLVIDKDFVISHTGTHGGKSA